MVGIKAKVSSVEIGAIIPGRAGLRNGGTGISDVGIGDATINPGGDQTLPGALVELVEACAVVAVSVA